MAIRCDNGPEFTSRHFLGWCEDHKIQLVNIQPGRLMQNSRVESFDGRLRDECPNTSWFETPVEARQKIEAWREDYNTERPHSSLCYRPPDEFAARSVPTSLLFAVETFDMAGCSVRQGNPSGELRSTLTTLRSGPQKSSTTAKRLDEVVLAEVL